MAVVVHVSIDIQEYLDSLCNALMHPVSDVNLISQVLPARHRAINFVAAPVGRTFLCLSCESPEQTVVFFLGERNDRIDTRILHGTDGGFDSLRALMQVDDPGLEAVCMASISQLVNPIFNSGSEKLTSMTALVAKLPVNDERVVGVTFGFPFGIRLGLHIFDDHRLSICFNDTCDEIVSQARKNQRLQIYEMQLNTDDKPRVAGIDWFDWLK